MIDRSDQVWMYNDQRDRFVVAYVHSPSIASHFSGHHVTVFYSYDERIWELGPTRWVEAIDDPWENDPAHFTRLV